ncbi:hydroxyacylglutathione hydrolase [Pararhizobium polonicum]|uniref:Hydroxyacylglutathione hydrolase n=1 Tax=Pararhizobium polonicum TaxID=1612624 RepID=A0A1C7NZU5_9HYPH|nr:FAD/NAD(P)-binding protein [Pararhizobium polonicum]OBZ94480.1 hydroxyacylglutathione hydrolase [Pararhizobium polonicum]
MTLSATGAEPAQPRDHRPVVAIIGGGVSGAATAFNLAQTGQSPAPDIIVFEPRESIGKGLAYDTAEPAHRINVPAARMSLLSDQPDQFLRWIEERAATAGDPDALRPDGNLFPQRSVFGDYINAMLQPLVANGTVRHNRSTVAHLRREGQRWSIIGHDGAQTLADIVVIATSHPPPVAPGRLQALLKDHPRFVPDPTKAGALDAIRPSDRVLVVGNGLTSADVIASLALKGHKGPITAVSRRGLRSRGHAPVPQEPLGDFLANPAFTARTLLKNIRSAIRQATSDGLTWHGVIDQVRAQGQALWQVLPLVERQRIVRHLRPYWDVHRFRVAPQVEAALDKAIAEGRLDILAGSVAASRVENHDIHCTLRLRRSPDTIEKTYDAVVVTTGPGHGGILASQPFLAELSENGYLELDPTGLGLSCTRNSEAIGPVAGVTPSLLIAGPLARGTFGELMGLPQVTDHAAFVASVIAGRLQAQAPKAVQNRL